MSLVESETKNFLVSTTDENTEVRTSTMMSPSVQLTGHQAAVNSVQFSPDGKFIATTGRDRNILLWDMSPQEVCVRQAFILRRSSSYNGLLLFDIH